MRRSLVHRLSVGVAFVTTLVVPALGHAELGGRVDTIYGDSVHLHARRASVLAAGHTSHALTLPNGGMVHEYANGDGIVFAITWTGPARPDLRQLLGDRFAQFQSEASARRGRLMQRHVDIDRPAMVVHSTGRPGLFRGIAYIPQLVPQGFSLDALS